MKRVVGLFLIIIMIFCLVACKHDVDDETVPTDTQDQTETIETEAPTENTTNTNPTVDETEEPTETTPSQPIYPTEVPTEPEEILLTITLGDDEFYLGVKLADLLEKHPPMPNYDSTQLVESGGTAEVVLKTCLGAKNYVTLGIYNPEPFPIAQKDCSVYSIELEGSALNHFAVNPTGEPINSTMSPDDILSILGAKDCLSYNYGGMDVHVWSWNRSLGQGLISIATVFDGQIGEMEMVTITRELYTWNLT